MMVADLANHPEANALGEYMSGISEEVYAAGWMQGTEWVLWRALTDWRAGKRAYWSPESKFPDDITHHMPTLDLLQKVAGGWVWWLDGMVFVPEERWLRLVEAVAGSERGWWQTENRELNQAVPPQDESASLIRPRITEYTVCALPEDHPAADAWAITVQYRGNELWAVTRHRQCLGSDGTWDYELLPTNRADEWLAAHRFDKPTALRLAVEAAPKVMVNGGTVADALAGYEPLAGGAR